MFIVINIIIIVILIKFMICKKNELNLSVLTGISLIIAGGTGNLIDRVFRGHVIDYIDINPMFKYPVFNIADICVVVGCIIIIINIIINIIKTRNE